MPASMYSVFVLCGWLVCLAGHASVSETRLPVELFGSITKVNKSRMDSHASRTCRDDFVVASISPVARVMFS